MEELVKLVPLFPLISFAIIGLMNRKLGKNMVAVLACAGVFLSFITATFVFVDLCNAAPGTKIEPNVFSWISAGSFSASISFLADPLSSIFLMVITGVGFLIHVFSVGYMKDDDGFRRFFAYLNLFIFFMLILVLGNNFLVMFIGWEGVGFCSFMLIGFWYKDQKNNDAAKKAFVMNRIGDLGFLIAMCLIFVNYNTLDYTTLFAPGFNLGSADQSTLTLITVCLFIGAMGKSAQIPLYTWLPDAMAGPTPVSALIHAATMVTAGIYMVARTNIMFSLTPDTMMFVAVIGIATSLLGATIGLFQNDIKKVLAYSTVSQLGLMFVALGVGAYTAAVFHVVTHAFFKALLFLGSGSVIHAMSGEQDIRMMGGLKKHLPVTYWTFLIGTLAISGIPPLAGFFSKDQILAETFAKSPVLYGLGFLVSVMTAFYMFRLFYLTFHGKFRGTHEQEHHLHESPFSMTFPLIVLAACAIFAGFLGLPHIMGHNWFEHFLEATLGKSALHLAEPTEIALMVITTVVILAVIFIVRYIFISKQTLPAPEDANLSLGKKIIYNKFFVDELYDKLVTKPVDKFSQYLDSVFDSRVVNGLVNAVGSLTVRAGQSVRMLQTGNIGFYVIATVIAIILLFLIFILRA